MKLNITLVLLAGTFSFISATVVDRDLQEVDTGEPCLTWDAITWTSNCTGATTFADIEEARNNIICSHSKREEAFRLTGETTLRDAKQVMILKCKEASEPCLSLADLEFGSCAISSIMDMVEVKHLEIGCPHPVNNEIQYLTGTTTTSAAKQFLKAHCIENRQACTSLENLVVDSCTPRAVFNAVKAEYKKVAATCNHNYQAELTILFGSIEEGNDMILDTCATAWDFTGVLPSSFETDVYPAFDSSFMANYTLGNTFLNDETGNFRGDDNPQYPVTPQSKKAGAGIRKFRNNAAKTTILEPVETLDQCQHQAIMCCFSRDRQSNDDNGDCNDNDCEDKGPGDNSNLCGVAEQPGNVHCHGLAWDDTNPQDPSAVFKYNNFFYVSLFDHMYTRGYVENVVEGQPMCGCIENMPAVTRADCTQIDVAQQFILTVDATGTIVANAVDDIFKVKFNSCQGIESNGGEEQNNDLASYVNRLNLEGRISDANQDAIRLKLKGYNDPDNNANAVC